MENLDNTPHKNRLVNAAALFIVIGSLAVLLRYGHEILFPIVMALLIAILLRPVVAFLNTRLRLPNVLAVLLAVVLALAFVGAVIFFISKEITNFMDDLPKIRQNLDHHMQHIEGWVYDKFNVSYTKQEDYIQQIRENGPANIEPGDMIGSFSAKLLNAVLIFIYTFLILIYRTLFFNFFVKLIPPQHHRTLQEILFEIKVVIRSYLVGLLTELGIVALMVGTGQWIVGVKYFIFLGLLTAILNLIPYIGILIATIISIFISLATSTELGSVLGVIAVNLVVHFTDSNILLPRIVGSKVRLNALASICGVVIGGTLVGVAGMFLAIPTIAILKVIFDRIEPLKPWGYLLGHDMPEVFHWKHIIHAKDEEPESEKPVPDVKSDEKPSEQLEEGEGNKPEKKD